jgi:hypothetical protein
VLPLDLVGNSQSNRDVKTTDRLIMSALTNMIM